MAAQITDCHYPHSNLQTLFIVGPYIAHHYFKVVTYLCSHSGGTSSVNFSVLEGKCGGAKVAIAAN
jgi:hypothetical protein